MVTVANWCPATWRANLVRRHFVICWLCFGFLGLLGGIIRSIVFKEMSLRIFLAVVFDVVVLVWCPVLLFSRGRCSLKTTELVLYSVSMPLLGLLIGTSSHNFQLGLVFVSLSFAATFGMPARFLVAGTLWSFVIYCATVLPGVRQGGHGVERSQVVGVFAFMVFLSSLGHVQAGFFGRLFDAEQSAAFEQEASKSLVSMLCDALLWLGEDERTVIACDDRFNSIVGKDMVGQKLESCLAQDDRDGARLERVLSATPVDTKPTAVTLLPATLQVENQPSRNVELFIVGRRKGAQASRVHIRSGYLIGVRLAEEQSLREAPESSYLADDFKDLTTAAPGAASLHNDGSVVENGNASQLSTEVSLVPTCATDLIFQRLSRDADASVTDMLSAVRQIGQRDHWLVEETDVLLLPGKPLGCGSFGMVARGVHFGAMVALKFARPVCKDGHEICNELQILRRLRHAHLVQLFGAIVRPQKQQIGLVLELMEHGDLPSFMSQKAITTVANRYEIVRGVCSALWFLHSRTPVVVHGDLKDHNVLVSLLSSGVRAKLTDFGISRLLTKHTQPLGGTVRWVAPEVFRRQDVRPRTSSDMFSFGRLVFYVATSRTPYDDIDQAKLAERLISGEVHLLQWEETSTLERACRPIAEQCMRPKASERPRAQDLHAIILEWRSSDLFISTSEGSDPRTCSL